MISYIRGQLAETFGDAVVVEAGNVGYHIFVPASVFKSLPGLGKEVKIYTYFSVREDAVTLFGFLSRTDLEMFKQLIGVNGVGPKSAMGLLSVLSPDELKLAVVSSDARRIAKAPGIGSKTAQRIILDLKDKIKPEESLYDGFVPDEGTEVFASGKLGKEAAEALTALGYSAGEAAKAVGKVAVTDDMTAEDILKAALKHLAFL